MKGPRFKFTRGVLPKAVLCSFFASLASCSKDRETDAEESQTGLTHSVDVLQALPDFNLSNQSAKRFGLAELKGKVWIADFIFTRCASTCPLQTAEKVKLQDVVAALPGGESAHLVTFTVDPEFDSPSVLEAYADSHGADLERWTFLTGSRGDLWNLSANGFKFDVALDARNTKMPILHSSNFALVDREGRVRGIYDGLTEDGRKQLLEDMEVVLAEPKTMDAGSRITYKPHPHPADVADPAWLETRKQVQLEDAKKIGAFHDFKFTNVVESTGITFKNRIVDDAGKYHKAVHYDHGNGIAIADVDGDGRLDLYFLTQIGSNELWMNLGGGKFRKAGTPAISLADKISVTASFADTDNDGDPDLFVTTVRGGNHFFENDGKGGFTDATESAGLGHVGHSSSGIFFDYDKDGLLDLFLCNVGVYTGEERGVGGYCIGLTDAFQGHTKAEERNERNLLYRNEGGNKFVDVSERTGLIDESWTGDAAPLDYNDDGWIDLYVLSMQGHDQLYENVGGKRFVKKSREVFPKTPWGAMGIQVFDFDNDGLQDIFVTDMHSDMSEPVPPNREKLKSDIKWDEKMLMSGGMSIYGNAFYRGLGDGKYEEISDKIGAENYWPWGLSSGDLNADGYIDAFVTSSMNFPFRYGVNSVLLNDGGKTFADAEFILGVEPRSSGRTAKPWFKLDPTGEDKNHPLVRDLNLTEPVEIWGALGTRSSAIFDMDDDGDLDIVTNEFHDGPMVLRSDLAGKKENLRWLKVKLRGEDSNRDGLGAVVTLSTSNGKSYTRVNDGVTGYLSHGVTPLYFGLGDAGAVDKVHVQWPSGKSQTIAAPESNQLIVVQESK